MKKLFYILAVTTCFVACKKYHNASDFKGTYTGTFRATGPNYNVQTQTELQLSSPQFEVTKNGEKFGSGTFKVDDRTTISFADGNAWTADFDWNTILSGSYTYQTLGDSLILTKDIHTANNLNKYQYRLKRVKD